MENPSKRSLTKLGIGRMPDSDPTPVRQEGIASGSKRASTDDRDSIDQKDVNPEERVGTTRSFWTQERRFPAVHLHNWTEKKFLKSKRTQLSVHQMPKEEGCSKNTKAIPKDTDVTSKSFWVQNQRFPAVHLHKWSPREVLVFQQNLRNRRFPALHLHNWTPEEVQVYQRNLKQGAVEESLRGRLQRRIETQQRILDGYDKVKANPEGKVETATSLPPEGVMSPPMSPSLPNESMTSSAVNKEEAATVTSPTGLPQDHAQRRVQRQDRRNQFAKE